MDRGSGREDDYVLSTVEEKEGFRVWLAEWRLGPYATGRDSQVKKKMEG